MISDQWVFVVWGVLLRLFLWVTSGVRHKERIKSSKRDMISGVGFKFLGASPVQWASVHVIWKAPSNKWSSLSLEMPDRSRFTYHLHFHFCRRFMSYPDQWLVSAPAVLPPSYRIVVSYRRSNRSRTCKDSGENRELRIKNAPCQTLFYTVHLKFIRYSWI